MQVQRFLVERGGDTAIVDGQGQVHEDELVGAMSKIPDEAVPFVEPVLEGRPLKGIRGWVRGRDPKADDVINEASIVEDVATTIDTVIFVGSEAEGSVRRGRGCTHGTAAELNPGCIAEGEEIILHDEREGFHQRLNGDVEEAGWVGTKVLADGTESLFRGNVGVHSPSIG